MKLSYTRRAKADLSEIFDYVAQAGRGLLPRPERFDTAAIFEPCERNNRGQATVFCWFLERVKRNL